MAAEESASSQSTNHVGSVKADHSTVINGNHYSTVHNHPTTDNIEERRSKARAEFLQRLETSPYHERKNRNPKRADGTCEWFTSHGLFHNWQEKTSALLWVSADPGCGKSVLSRHLVEDVCPSDNAQTTCYFFFKDDFEDQKTLEGALCSILHQLFTQEPLLLSDETIDEYIHSGNQMPASFDGLWRILLKAATRQDQGGIICVLDALDECEGVAPLGAALTELYSEGRGLSNLKFLVTSRPYLRIRREFQDLIKSQPTIHLSGESQEEVDKISREIDIVIDQRIIQVSDRLQLDSEEQQILRDGLSVVTHRTYLWVYLVFAEVEQAVHLSKEDLRDSIRNLPHTVEEVYEKILRKSPDPHRAKEILQIVVAAARPMHLTEMAVILAFQPHKHRTQKDLDGALRSTSSLHSAVREACGLFVVVQDSRVFLLHQTAREFLVPISPQSSKNRSPSLQWQFSPDLKDSHRLLSKICVAYLLLARPDTTSDPKELDAFFDYAATNWTDHYRHAQSLSDADQARSVLQLCSTGDAACKRWLEVFGQNRLRQPKFVKEVPTTLLLVSYFGFDNLFDLALLENRKALDAKSRGGRTALSFACEKGYDSIVRKLLHHVSKHEASRRRFLSRNRPAPPGIVNHPDKSGRTPLSYAAESGHRSIVKRLLKRDAKIDAVDNYGFTPLSWAGHHGHNDVVKLLVKKGARQHSKPRHLERKDASGRTPLYQAAESGNEVVVEMLLDQGVNIEATDPAGSTPLIIASFHGHKGIIKLLLDRGANVKAVGEFRWTALHSVLRSRKYTSRNDFAATLQLLLDQGADPNALDQHSDTPLLVTLSYLFPPVSTSALGFLRGESPTTGGLHEGCATRSYLVPLRQGDKEAAVRLLLDHGANPEGSDVPGRMTALHSAANSGDEAIVKLLLDRGANLEASTSLRSRALQFAARSGSEAVVKLLLDRGANLEASNRKGYRALHYASKSGVEAIVKLLLDGGANLEASDIKGSRALHYASEGGSQTMVKLLLDRGADIDAPTKDGRTALHLARLGKYEFVAKLLESRGADAGALDKKGQTPQDLALERP